MEGLARVAAAGRLSDESLRSETGCRSKPGCRTGDMYSGERTTRADHLIFSRLGYFIRPGKHDMTATERKAWMDFADIHLRASDTDGSTEKK